MKIEDIIQLQMVQSVSGQRGGQTVYDMVFAMILQTALMMIISFMDELKKLYPQVVNHYKSRYVNTITRSIQESHSENMKDKSISLTQRHKMNKVSLTRIYASQDVDTEQLSNMNEIVDGVLEHVATLHNVPLLEFIDNSTFIAMYTETPIQILPEVYISIGEIVRKDLCSLQSIKLTVMSETKTSKELSNLILQIHSDYVEKMTNSIGEKIFYFGTKRENNGGDLRGHPTMSPHEIKLMMIRTAPKVLEFSMQEYASNKTFDTLYGDLIRNVYEHVKFFQTGEEWYYNKGLPYHLGMMFVGKPGCGKTATIKAIANYTKRHIINVNFKDIKTATQLRNLFYQKELSVVKINGEKKTLSIPLNKRLYVLEEIDTIGNIVKKRTCEDDTSTKLDDELTLGEILTILDGTLETPGRMMIITSNHPEQIDDALMRPGRVDLLLKFEKASRSTLVEMYEKLFDKTFPTELIKELPHEELSTAEVQQVLLKHIHKKNVVIDAIIKDLKSFLSDREKAIGVNKPIATTATSNDKQTCSGARRTGLVEPNKATSVESNYELLRESLETSYANKATTVTSNDERTSTVKPNNATSETPEDASANLVEPIDKSSMPRSWISWGPPAENSFVSNEDTKSMQHLDVDAYTKLRTASDVASSTVFRSRPPLVPAPKPLSLEEFQVDAEKNLNPKLYQPYAGTCNEVAGYAPFHPSTLQPDVTG